MDFFKIAVLVVVTVLMTEILKSTKSALTPFPPLLLCVYILCTCVGMFSDLFAQLGSYIPEGISSGGFKYLIKITGICLATDFVSEFSADCQSRSLSNAVNLFGRISMIICVLPLVREILEYV